MVFRWVELTFKSYRCDAKISTCLIFWNERYLKHWTNVRVSWNENYSIKARNFETLMTMNSQSLLLSMFKSFDWRSRFQKIDGSGKLNLGQILRENSLNLPGDPVAVHERVTFSYSWTIMSWLVGSSKISGETTKKHKTIATRSKPMKFISPTTFK